MKRILLLFMVVALAALIPGAALADDGTRDDGFTMRVSGDYTLPAGETVGALLVIDGDAHIAGTVTDTMWVINGNAFVTGTVEHDITVIRGDLDLQNNAHVKNVTMVDGDLTRHTGATVTGNIDETDAIFWPGLGITLGIVFFVITTVAVVVAGLGFAAIGGRQLTTAAANMTAHPGRTILAGFIAAVGLPIAAVLAMLTVVGIGVGLGMLFFVLPALVLLGWIVAGTMLGMLILDRGKEPAKAHPYAEAALGLFTLQIVAAIPGFGIVAFVLMGIWGTGALAYMAYRGLRPAGKAPAAPLPGAGAPMPT